MEGKRMKFENIKTYNFGPALRGMRNPLESWDKSDSFFGLINIADDEHDYDIADLWVQATKDPAYPENYSKSSSDLADEYDRWLIKNGLLEIEFDNQMANLAARYMQYVPSGEDINAVDYVNNNIHKNRAYLFTVFCGYCG